MKKFTYVYRNTKGQLWVEGVRKRVVPKWAQGIPNRTQGFVEINGDIVTVYKKNWKIKKKYRIEQD